jgi:hypothetical protein
MSLQAEGGNSRVIIANESTFKSPPEAALHTCEAAWDELVDADVTASADAVDFKVGTKSCKLAVADGCGAGDILATDAIAVAVSLAAVTHVGAWVKSSVALDAGDLQLLLDNTASCASPLETLDIPALVANTWTRVNLALVAPASDTAIVSIGVKMAVDSGAFNFWIDDIRGICPAVVLPIKSEDVSMAQELLRSECLTATRNQAEPILGNIAIDGPVSTELAPYMVRLFKHMLGTMAVTGAGAPYTYTGKVGALPTALTYEKGFSDVEQYFRNDGVRVATWKLSGEAGKINPLELTFMGAKETNSQASFDPAAVSYPHRPFTTFKAQIKQGVAGTVLGTITAFSIEGNNDLDGDSYVIDSTGERYCIPAGKLVCSGSLTSLFTDVTLYDLAKAGTTTKIVIEMWHGTGAGTTDGNEKMTITLDEVKLKPKAPGISGPKGIRIEHALEAFYSSGANASSCMFEVLLPNNTTLY